ncbi:uncharacterized protein LOC106134405 [Amyelois transitella]|uniref:uncharacterized protein LOC106134405 n=1 Tax=Amyelois transitella TaxID=680683 RepID=UPI00299031AA|nr:uncharacterized protein LOC106134405 [Amyelois transitella]
MRFLETLSRFGPKYCDLPDFLWNMTVLLRLFILDIDSRNKKGLPIISYFIFPLILFAFVYVYLISGPWYVLYRSLQMEEINEKTRIKVLSMVICSQISPIKWLFLLINSSGIKVLLDKYLSCDAEVEPDSRMAINIKTKMREIKMRAITYWLLVMMTGVLFDLRPFFYPNQRTAIVDDFIFYGLEPMLETPYYELGSLMMTLGSFFTVYPPATINGMLIALVGYTECQLLALSCELTSIWDDAEEHCEKLKDNQTGKHINEIEVKNTFISNKLRSIYKSHVTNIALVREIERLFKNAFAGELFMMIVSLTIELLGGLEKTYDQIPFAFFCIGIECYLGQKLIDAGIVFENALYDSKWENFDVSNRKSILLMLMNAQNTLNLSAGGIAIMHYELLMSMLKSIYSAYKTLETQE